LLIALQVWLHGDFPLQQIGKLVLNRNPANYFAEVEQAAFSPGRLVPGIEASPDPILQSRLFSYQDTQLYRVGTNFMQLPINCPLNQVNTHTQDGAMCVLNRGASINYGPSELEQNEFNAAVMPSPPTQVSGLVARQGWQSVPLEIDLLQPLLLWRDVFSTDDRKECALNLATSLANVRESIRERQMALFRACDPEIERAVRAALESMPSPPASNILIDPETLATKQSPAREGILHTLAGGLLRATHTTGLV